MKENKIWGNTSLIWAGNNTEVHRIKIDKGCYCSKHKHESKWNYFFVERGELVIEIWNESGIVDETVLTDGESTSVPPGIYHKFTSVKETEALEIYYVYLKSNDIIRETTGGRL